METWTEVAASIPWKIFFPMFPYSEVPSPLSKCEKWWGVWVAHLTKSLTCDFSSCLNLRVMSSNPLWVWGLLKRKKK